MEKKKRNCLIDYLKAVAVVLVIVNHTLADTKTTWLYFFVVRMAVPIFVLLSGFNYTASVERMRSPFCWYERKRLLKKLTTYICPMFVVFFVWCVKEATAGGLNIWTVAREFVLQSYGYGAYYFWIAVQLYLMFPVVYVVTHKVRAARWGGYTVILLINVAYEFLLYFLEVPMSLYRIIALRYVMLLACGCWIHNVLCESSVDIGKSIEKKRIAALIVSFVCGCCYIVFYGLNWKNAELFRYRTWANTNVCVCLYIVPIFYAIMVLLNKKKIGIEWLHRAISRVGQSSYYILCTQLIMFWYINPVWDTLSLSLLLRGVFNVAIGIVTGVGVHQAVNAIQRKSRISERQLQC